MTPEEAKAARDKRAAEIIADAAARPRMTPYIVPTKAAEPDKAHPTASPDFKAAARKEGDEKEQQEESLGAPKDEADKAGKDLRAEREEQRLDTPVSFGGERQPSFMGTLARIADDPMGVPAALSDYLPDNGFGDVVRSLLPQAADTETQAADREARMASAKTAREEAEQEITSRLANLKQGSMSPDEFMELVEQAKTPGSFEATEYAPAHPARSDAQAALIEQYPELAGPIDEAIKATAEEEKVDRMADAARGHESLGSYALRLLGAPPSAAAGLAEGVLTDKTIGEAIADRIRGGEGFTGGGIDLGRAVGDKVGTMAEQATGLPLAAPIRTYGTVAGGTAGFMADLATPLDLGIGDLATGGRFARRAVEGVPRELTPSVLEEVVTSAIPGAKSTPQSRSLSELRNRVGGIPSVHAMESKALAKEFDVDVKDAAAYQLARGLADEQTAPGEALVYQISRALGGETDVVTAAGQAERQAARARLLADRAATTERAGTAARTAAAELDELRRLEADDLDLARSLRDNGQVEAAERIERRVAESSRITKAEEVLKFKEANLTKYKAQRAEVSRLRQAEALRLEEEAARARSKADTFQHYGRVAEGILNDGPKAGTSEKIETLVENVRALLAPKVQMAPGDGKRALGHAYMQKETWNVLADVVGKSTDPVMAGVQAELALGSQEFLSAIKVKAPQLAKSLEKASAIGDNSALGKLLNDRAAVARKLAEYNEITAGAPARTRRAWAWLQQTCGYGVPLIDDTGRPMIASALGAGAREGVSMAAGAMRSGMLSGFLVPNPKFFLNNLLTGPAIIMSTLGPRMAVASVLSLDGITVLRALEGNAAARARQIAPGWTGADVARLVAEHGISRSQAAEELGSRGIEALTEFAERASQGRFKSHLKSLAGYGDNFWAEVANWSDGMFRINVLTRALKDGRPVEEAVVLARESLFDYGNLTDFERNYIGKAIWFWTFRRNNYRAMMRNVLSNPARLSSLAAINNASSEPTPDNGATTFLATQHYAENSPMWRLVSDEETQLRYALTGPSIPAVQAVEDMMDAMSVLALLVEDAGRNTGGSGALAAGDRLRDSLLTNTNPVAAAVISTGFGIAIQSGGDAALPGTLDPRFAWYLQQIPGMWEAAVTYFDLVEVADEDEAKRGGNFIPGEKSEKGTGQWKIGTDAGKRKWALAMFALAGTGTQRPLREYAPWLAWAEDLAGDASVVAPNIGNAPGTTTWERFGILAGVLTPVNMPAFEQTVTRNAEVREREVIPPSR